MVRAIGIMLCMAMIGMLFPYQIAVGATVVTTTNGSAIIYARNTDYTTSLSGSTDGYSLESATAETTGQYLLAKKGTSSTPTGSMLSFSVTADQAGRYNLWIRSKASSSSKRTWFDYNNKGFTSIELNTSNQWTWKKLVGGYYLNAGETFSIRLYPRDSGHCIDEFIFTNKSTYEPSGIVKDVSTIVNLSLPATYGMPTIIPPNEHPRVMFTQDDIPTIISNSAKSQNSGAKSHLDSLVQKTFSGTRRGSSGTSNYSITIENYIEANAFYYAVYGGITKGRKAVDELINYLKTVRYDERESDITRFMGCTVFKAAEVYDWCYDLLTDSEKQTIIENVEGIICGMEIGYPVTGQSSITGHGSEAQLLRDLLAFGIAVYDERPDIYNHVMGRIENQIVPSRNYFYQSHSTYQGTSYGWYRYYWELYATQLVSAMTKHTVSLFSPDFHQVGYYMIYSRRPDGRMFIQGDDATLSWQYYNGFSFQAAKMAGDLFDDPYLKGEYRMQRGADDFENTNFKDEKSFNSVLWLIMNNPRISFKTDRSDLPLSRYFGSPNGVIMARTGWSYDTKTPKNSNVVAAMMKIGEHYGSNHDHLDAGTFQLFYKGILASDSGIYKGYASSHDKQYYKRTIAHNAITIYDPNETFNVLSGSASNDGGQLWQDEAGTFQTWTSGKYHRATVLDHEIAEDNSYSYIKGDITPAYNESKASEVIRSMSFIPTADSTFPAIMVIYDKVTSKKSSQIKKFLLHTQTEPTISGSTIHVVNDNTITWSTGATAVNNGRLTVHTLLPANPTITKIGGSGREYWVNGTNYPPTSTANSYDEAGWGRVEISASTEGTTTEFLNVLAVSDGGSTASFTSTLINGTNVVGAKALDKVVMFSNSKDRISKTANFTVAGNEENLHFTVFGVKEGQWTVKCNGNVIATPSATSEGGTIVFSGPAGSYTLSYSRFPGFYEQLVAQYELKNNTNQGITDDHATTWVDLSGNGYDIPLHIDSNNYWSGKGLHVTGGSEKNIILPQIFTDTMNHDQFTLEFVVHNIVNTDMKQCVSLFGNTKNSFAIYKIIGYNKVYIKMPGWYTVLKRPYALTEYVDGSHNIISVDRKKGILHWYINGQLVESRPYNDTGSISERIRLVSDGGSVDYEMIKLFATALTDTEVAYEYQRYFQ